MSPIRSLQGIVTKYMHCLRINYKWLVYINNNMLFFSWCYCCTQYDQLSDHPSACLWQSVLWL